MNVVISLGGSLVASKLDATKILQFSDLFKKIVERGHKIILVVGGGRYAREYIDISRKLGASETLCDEIGTLITRANAGLFLAALKRLCYPLIPKDFEEVASYFKDSDIVVMGGTFPTISTDGTASIAAEKIEADLMINATSVDGVYTKDPNKEKDGIFVEEITYEELKKAFIGQEIRAGTYPLLDQTAISTLSRSNIPCMIVNGENPNNIMDALDKKGGTLVTKSPKKDDFIKYFKSKAYRTEDIKLTTEDGIYSWAGLLVESKEGKSLVKIMERNNVTDISLKILKKNLEKNKIDKGILIASSFDKSALDSPLRSQIELLTSEELFRK